MIRSVLALALIAGSLGLSACDAKTLTAALDTAGALSNSGPKVRVSGSVYAFADQMAVVAAGGLNYRTAARSDEKGVPRAKVKFSALQGLASGTTQADDTGKFSVEVPEGDYKVTATFDGKKGSLTMNGLIHVGGAVSNFQMDYAHHMLASKLIKLGVKSLDASKLSALESALDSDFASVNSQPAIGDTDSGAAAFDSYASADTKADAAALAK